MTRNKENLKALASLDNSRLSIPSCRSVSRVPWFTQRWEPNFKKAFFVDATSVEVLDCN